MKRTKGTPSKDDSRKGIILHLAFDLGHSKWKLAFSDGEKKRTVNIAARDLEAFQEEIRKARIRFGLARDAKILSCYEAGRDGFWLHRYLLSCGIENVVVDSASIEVSRRKRRAKTDRIDAMNLLKMLLRYHSGEKGLWSVVHVPSVEDEAGRHLHREMDCLKKERTMHRNRIKSLLIQQGIAVKNPSRTKFLEDLKTFKMWDGHELPGDLITRIMREHSRLRMVEDQLYSLKREQATRLEEADTVSLRKVSQLMTLRGIGMNSSWKFVMEFFGWRNFKNRREVGSLSGLTPTPYDSGGKRREQGISKAGNKRIRTLAIEMGWVWLRYQPQSKLSRWFLKRFASGGSRMRRIGIVAVARRLLVDLWRYLQYGVIPEGAVLKAAGS